MLGVFATYLLAALCGGVVVPVAILTAAAALWSLTALIASNDALLVLSVLITTVGVGLMLGVSEILVGVARLTRRLRALGWFGGATFLAAAPAGVLAVVPLGMEHGSGTVSVESFLAALLTAVLGGVIGWCVALERYDATTPPDWPAPTEDARIIAAAR